MRKYCPLAIILAAIIVRRRRSPLPMIPRCMDFGWSHSSIQLLRLNSRLKTSLATA